MTVKKSTIRRSAARASAGALAAGAVAAAGGVAEAASGDLIDVGAVDGVANVKVLSDGSIEAVLQDGRVVRIAAEDVVIEGDQILVSRGALADVGLLGDAGAAGVGGFLAENALFVGLGAVAVGGGVAAAVVTGDDDDDGLAPTEFDDVLIGGAGADTIDGLGGNDQINGGAGDDNLAGGAGNDTIDGGAGADAIAGEDGDDTLIVDGDDVAISGAAGADTIDLSQSAVAANVDLDVNAAGASTPGAESTQTGRLTFAGGADQALDDIENIVGTDFADVLFGNTENNVIDAGAGDDRVHGFGGADTLDGGEGVDIILLNQAGGPVTIDLAAGTVGASTIANFENANGGGFDDTLIGDDGANVLIGGGGADTLVGNGGDDTFVTDGVDAIDGGDGTDTADFSALTASVFVDLDVNSAGGAGTPGQEGAVLDAAPNAGGAQILDLDDIENVNGGSGDDVIFGNNEINILNLGDGDDAAHSFGGADFINGGDGVDTALFSAGGAIVVDLDDNGDAVVGGAGDTLTSIENIVGSNAGDDVISGNAGVNVLNGNGGDDVLNGRGGADVLIGGAGADAFSFDGDPFDGADVSAAGRQIVGGEDDIADFDFAEDFYLLNATDFDVSGDVSFAAVDANDPGAVVPPGANVIVLLNSDNDGDPSTPFVAGTAANQIADLVDDDGAGFFVYFNSNLDINRLVYSTNLNDADADLSIVSRQSDLTGMDAINALALFSEDNFQFEDVQVPAAGTTSVPDASASVFTDLGADADVEFANAAPEAVGGSLGFGDLIEETAPAIADGFELA
ncbi:MAG: beta strand repeat-containing protein [Parvularculaceae bacterium]